VVAWYASGETPDLESWDPTTAPLPAEALSPKSLGRACHDALGDLEEESPVVTRYLRQLGSGLPVDEVAKRAKISREILFQRIFRGREQLDRRLVARGVRT
jgi:DNA-directed RNA polymerase specialized sigma24 family protein